MPRSTYFIAGNGLEREVLIVDLTRYLGNDTLVRPGAHQSPKNGLIVEGYYVTADRPPTANMLADLRRDSALWQEEKRKDSRLNHFDYKYSLPDPPQNYLPDFQQPLHKPAYSTPAYHPPTPIRSLSEPVRSEGGNIRDIRLIHPVTGESRNATVLLDTGCTTDNWISGQKVAMLGADLLIDRNAPIKTMQAANMGAVQSRGTVTLDWRWLPKGTKTHTAAFNVIDASHFDVIIGYEFLEEKGLLKWNEDAFSPLTEYNSVISPNESEAMRQARERQLQEKAEREAARERQLQEKAEREAARDRGRKRY